MGKVKNVRIVAQYRKIDMDAFARVLAMLVEERHRARLMAEQEANSESVSPDTVQEQ